MPPPDPGIALGPVAHARAEGRDSLLETEVLQIVAAAGIGAPRHLVVAPGEPVPDLGGLRSDRVVVKVLCPGLLHKLDRGGVAIARRDPAAVAAAVEVMAARFSDEPVTGFLIAEFVAHDHPGWLLGVRRTADFGVVVTVSAGGREVDRPGPVAVLPAWAAADGPFAAAARRALADPALQAASGGLDPAAGLAVMARVARLVAECPPQIAEIEINPLVFPGPEPIALDGVARLGPAPLPEAPPRPLEAIRSLLEPQSIAVVGVSERANPGRVILRNILAGGFPAERVRVVKPGIDEIEGCRCVPDLASLPEPADLLVLAVEAAAIPALIDECIAHRAAASVIVVTGGLGERAGSEHLEHRVELSLHRARRSDRRAAPVVTGANSMGVRSAPGGFDATFIPPEKQQPPPGPPTPLAVLAQSGAFTLSRLDRFPRMQPRYVVTLGNQIDLTAGDYLAYLTGERDGSVVACYLEGFRPGDGRRWLEAAAEHTGNGGRVISYLGGRTPDGARAAATHTASVAPDHRVARALAEAAGVLVAGSFEEWEDLARVAVLLRDRSLDGLRLGAVSNAGFEAVAVADNLGPLALAEPDPETVATIEAILAAHRLDGIVGVQNPLDLTPIAPDAAFAAAVEAILADPGIDLGVVGCVPFTPALATLPEETGADAVAERLAALWRATHKAWTVVLDAGPRYDPMAGSLEDAGIPVFRSMDRAVRALGKYAAARVAGSALGLLNEALPAAPFSA